MAIADELIAVLGFDLRGEDNAKRYEKRLDEINKKLGKFAANAGRVAGLAAVALASGFGLLGKSVIETSAQFETFQATLETIEGSAEKARASLDWIAEFGKTTPYDVAQVTDSFVKLKAYGIDPIANDALRTLGDTAAAMGKSLNQAVEAFADASTGEFERLKEFGIKAKTVGEDVTFSWSKDGEELSKTVKKNATEIRTFLLETMGDRFAGAMDRQSQTFKGITSNLGDSWTDFQRRIGEAGFFENVSKKLQSLLDTVNRLDKDGRLDEWATSLSNSLSKTADVIWAISSRIANDIMFLTEHFESFAPALKTIGVLVGVLVARAFPLVTVMVLAGLAIDDLIAYMQGGDSVIGDFIQKIQDLTGVSEGVAQAMAGVGAAAIAALSAAFIAAPVKVVALLSRGLVAGLVALGPVILQAAVSAFALLSNPVGWAVIIGAVAAGLIWYFWDDLVALWAQLEPMITGLWSQMSDWLLGIDWAGVGASMMMALWNGMKSIGGMIQDWFTGLIPDWAKGFLGGSDSAPMTQEQRSNARHGISNLTGNLDRSSVDSAMEGVANDNRQDNREFPMTVSTTINQTVSQASSAPGQAAAATGKAVNQAVAGQRSQIETEPAF